jgi:hypothetical protein
MMTLYVEALDNVAKSTLSATSSSVSELENVDCETCIGEFVTSSKSKYAVPIEARFEPYQSTTEIKKL